MNSDEYTIDLFKDEEMAEAIQWMSDRCHFNSVKKGFWEGGKEARNKAEMIALMHSELSEALEALRKDPTKPDHHCPEYTNLEIELADCVIRIMDFCSGFGLRLGEAIVSKHQYNTTRSYKHGKKF